MFVPIADILRDSKKIVFLTGAGVSNESGIPTFRGKGGYWKKHNPLKLATKEAFRKEPAKIWDWYYQRRRLVLASRPNDGHKALKHIAKYKKTRIITQNVDGLHQKAGSRNIIELHGNIFKAKCTFCNFKTNLGKRFPATPLHCAKCGNLLRPDIVWFDENVPKKIWEKAKNEVKNCDVLVIVGTSLSVDPANILPRIARKNHAILVEINPIKTKYSKMMDLSLRVKASKGLRELAKTLAKKESRTS